MRDSRTVIIVLTPESIKFVDSNQAITEYASHVDISFRAEISRVLMVDYCEKAATWWENSLSVIVLRDLLVSFVNMVRYHLL